jgi:hypothetical protein
MSYGADLQILVSLVPKEQSDAALVFGSQVHNSSRMVYVLEVLSDRSQGRIGRWSDFAVDEQF